MPAMSMSFKSIKYSYESTNNNKKTKQNKTGHKSIASDLYDSRK